MDVDRDLIIVGAGTAGLSAALFAAAEDLDVLLIEQLASGGQQLLVSHIANFPGFAEGVGGLELSTLMERQAVAAGAEITNGSVRSIRRVGPLVHVELDEAPELKCRAAIVATGTEPRPLGVPGEEQFRGLGVSACASCDGPLFRGKRVAVVGGGDSACDEALYLTDVVDGVLLVHRGPKLNAQAGLVRRVSENPRIQVRPGTTVTAIGGEALVSRIELRGPKGETTSEAVAAVFVFVGSRPRSAVVPEAGLDAEGYLVTGGNLETSVPGVFAAGAVRACPYRQFVTAAADGAVAAHSAALYLHGLSEDR